MVTCGWLTQVVSAVVDAPQAIGPWRLLGGTIGGIYLRPSGRIRAKMGAVAHDLGAPTSTIFKRTPDLIRGFSFSNLVGCRRRRDAA